MSIEVSNNSIAVKCMMKERQIEDHLIDKLRSDLKYVYREDIYDRDTLERNFREKFEHLNRVHL